jgi:hypothetical protein
MIVTWLIAPSLTPVQTPSLAPVLRQPAAHTRQGGPHQRGTLELRNLIELITAEPRAEGRGLDLLVHGRLTQILHIADDRPNLS